MTKLAEVTIRHSFFPLVRFPKRCAVYFQVTNGKSILLAVLFRRIKSQLRLIISLSCPCLSGQAIGAKRKWVSQDRRDCEYWYIIVKIDISICHSLVLKLPNRRHSSLTFFAGECRWQGKFWEGVLKEFYLGNKFSFLWHISKKQGPFGNFRNANRQG